MIACVLVRVVLEIPHKPNEEQAEGNIITWLDLRSNHYILILDGKSWYQEPDICFMLNHAYCNVALAYCRNIKSINARESCLKYGVAILYRSIQNAAHNCCCRGYQGISNARYADLLFHHYENYCLMLLEVNTNYIRDLDIPSLVGSKIYWAVDWMPENFRLYATILVETVIMRHLKVDETS